MYSGFMIPSKGKSAPIRVPQRKYKIQVRYNRHPDASFSFTGIVALT